MSALDWGIVDYECFGCDMNCIRDSDMLIDMGILVNGKICNRTCLYTGFKTDFVPTYEGGCE